MVLDGPLFHHLIVVSPVLQVRPGSFHEVVLKLSYAAVELEVLLVQGSIKVSLVASFGHTKLDLQVTDLASTLQESSELVAQNEDGDHEKERQTPKEVPSIVGVIFQTANFLTG